MLRNRQPDFGVAKEGYSGAEHWDNVLRTEFEKESDRAAVILVASLFDNALGTYLRNTLLPTPTATDDLFDAPNAPLGSFSAKIILSYRLGLISVRFGRDLHLIRKIRNEFAHNIHGCTFETSAVRSRILELAKSSGMLEKSVDARRTFPKGARGDFMMMASWMLWALHSRIDACASIQEAKLEFGYLDVKPTYKPPRRRVQKTSRARKKTTTPQAS
jgi:hypothetical protein